MTQVLHLALILQLCDPAIVPQLHCDDWHALQPEDVVEQGPLPPCLRYQPFGTYTTQLTVSPRSGHDSTLHVSSAKNPVTSGLGDANGDAGGYLIGCRTPDGQLLHQPQNHICSTTDEREHGAPGTSRAATYTSASTICSLPALVMRRPVASAPCGVSSNSTSLQPHWVCILPPLHTSVC